MPFGAGQRTCVGQRFAVLEAVVLLASIARRFELSLPDRAPGQPDPVKEHLAITLRPLNLRLVLNKRAT
jgi:cytochrome P450